MTVFLIIVSLYGGVEKLPMNSEASCRVAAEQFNRGLSLVARAFCVAQ